MKIARLFILLIILCQTFRTAAQGNSKGTTIGAADTLFFAGRWEEAKKMYEAMISQTPPANIRPVTWNRLGYTFQMTGKYESAIINYKKVLSQKQINPQLKASAQSRMARVYSLKKDVGQSISFLDSAVTSGYLGLNELDTLKDYNNIRKDPRFNAIYKRVYNSIYPCAANLKYREFDFWIGEWDVYNTGTTTPKVGHSLIQNVAGECLILENWTALGSVPNNGKSMNFYDTTTGKWEQVWMGSGGGLAKFVGGVYAEGAMRFTADPAYLTAAADGKKPLARFSFYNQAPGNVRQWYEQSNDGGTTWQTVYDFTYIKRK